MAKLKVLLIDDNADFLKIMSTHIKGWGYDIRTASSGKAGINAMKDEAPDIIILDYVMPDMDGLRVLKQIRKIDNELPVIMFTANPDIKSVKGTKKLGVTAYIPKLSIYMSVPSAVKEVLDRIKAGLK